MAEKSDTVTPENPVLVKSSNKFVKQLLYVVSAGVFMAVGAYGHSVYLEGITKNNQQSLTSDVINSPTETTNLSIDSTASSKKKTSNQNEVEIPPYGDIATAKKVLLLYFDLLHDGRYEEAMQFHGSGYRSLQGWNPNVRKTDYAKLLENGCTKNGLHCLKVSSVIEEKTISSGVSAEYLFKVQFSQDDGSLFKYGPCCGSSEDSPVYSSFDYTVKMGGGGFVVLTPPVFTP